MSAQIKVQLVNRRIVINATRATGGVSHTSEKVSETRNGEAVETHTRGTRNVDHDGAVKRIDQANRRVITTIKKHARHTPLGWIVPEDRVDAMESDLQEAYGACHDANRYAESEGSARRVQPAIAYASVDWNDPSLSRLVFDALAERVQAQVDLAKSLPVDRLAEVKAELLQIATLVSGPARQCLECAARDIHAIKRDRLAGKEPDLSVLEAAVGWFTL